MKSNTLIKFILSITVLSNVIGASAANATASFGGGDCTVDHDSYAYCVEDYLMTCIKLPSAPICTTEALTASLTICAIRYLCIPMELPEDGPTV